MREIKAVNITPGDFAPFGTYYSMTEPEGYPLQGEIHKFYPDRISGTCMGCKLRSNGMPVPLLRNGYSIFNGTKYR